MSYEAWLFEPLHAPVVDDARFFRPKAAPSPLLTFKSHSPNPLLSDRAWYVQSGVSGSSWCSFGRTSGRSTKLIHGGIRYLERAFKKLDKESLDLVEEALEERAYMLQARPHRLQRIRDSSSRMCSVGYLCARELSLRCHNQLVPCTSGGTKSVKLCDTYAYKNSFLITADV